ncbi:MAG: GHKL domain-containing protein [Ruminococcus sp.]|nr:GHKL domain-containing protein [Ruminococcus sp.]
MLGGSFWVAILRNGMSITLMLSFFLMLDRPRFSMKKTICCYAVFGLFLLFGFSVWYLLDYESFVKIAPLTSFPVIGIFCSLMSGEIIYISLYKMAATFYLFSVGTFLGVDVARWWFQDNLWVDILVRFLCYSAMLIFTWKRFRKEFLEGVDFLIEEMDPFSTVTLFVSVFFGAIIAYWPNLQGFSIFNMVRAFFVLFMAGVLQYTILHLYIHLGREHYFQTEKELLELNEQLLRSQLDLVRESEKEAARIRHDARHHILLIKEYVEKGDKEHLLSYLEQYGEDVEKRRMVPICANPVVNSILSAYARQAQSKNIHVSMDVGVPQKQSVRDIDWVAILANVFENAIHGCVNSGKPVLEIDIYIAKKGSKIIIQCSNTCAEDVRIHMGMPKSGKRDGQGISSIVKTVARYNGETDFVIEDGRFVTRILLNLQDKA